MCACLELANCRAENCQLKKKLTEYEAKICSLEQLVATIAEEQNQIRQEVIELRNETQGATSLLEMVSCLLAILASSSGK